MDEPKREMETNAHEAASWEQVPASVSTALLRTENCKVIVGVETSRDLRQVRQLQKGGAEGVLLRGHHREERPYRRSIEEEGAR